jgi:hypothetical protein
MIDVQVGDKVFIKLVSSLNSHRPILSKVIKIDGHKAYVNGILHAFSLKTGISRDIDRKEWYWVMNKATEEEIKEYIKNYLTKTKK